jgi:hypothetical protein
MKKGFVFALWLSLFWSPALAQQVPAPINAPSSVTTGHALCATANAQQAADCGAAPVTGVTASAPLASSGGTTPAITLSSPLPIANGGTNATGGLGAANNLSLTYTVCQSGAPVSLTGTTAETVLATCTIPASALSANGCFTVWAIWSETVSSTTGQLLTRYAATSGTGGTEVMGYTINNVAYTSFTSVTRVCNLNATNSQVAFTGAVFLGAAAAGLARPAVDTTASSVVSIDAKPGSASDTFTLMDYAVTLGASAGN